MGIYEESPNFFIKKSLARFEETLVAYKFLHLCANAVILLFLFWKKIDLVFMILSYLNLRLFMLFFLSWQRPRRVLMLISFNRLF